MATRRRMVTIGLILSCSIWAGAADADNPADVIVVGDSITAGYGASSSHSYIADLAGLLGSGTNVAAFGHPGATMLSTSQSPFVPYITQPEYTDATTALMAISTGTPTDLVIMLGTNDSNVQNWFVDGGSSANQFVADYSAMIDHFAGLGPHPHVYLTLPPAIFTPESAGWSDCILHQQIIPLIQQVASQRSLPVIDVYAATAGHPEYFLTSSNVLDIHPNDQGHAVIARVMYDALTGNAPEASLSAAGGACDGGSFPLPDAAVSLPDADASVSSHEDGAADAGPTMDGQTVTPDNDAAIGGSMDVATPAALDGATTEMSSPRSGAACTCSVPRGDCPPLAPAWRACLAFSALAVFRRVRRARGQRRSLT